MATENNLYNVRTKALARVDRLDRNFKIALGAFAVLEALFLLTFLSMIDRGNKLHLVLFVASGGFYTLLILGMVILGMHVSRNTQLVLRALELLDEQRGKQ